jgi:hypothetical protein
MSEDIFNEDSKEDDTPINGIVWGGEIIMNNEIIQPIIIADLGVPVHIPQEPQINNSPARRRNSPTTQPRKYFKSNTGARILKRNPEFYVKLNSGEELFFNETDGISLLLNDILEPSRLIRNIISRVPQRVSERLEYLEKFNDNTNDTDDSEEETSLKDKVYTAYIREWRLRFIFKKLLILWRAYKMNKTSEREVDPITLCYPEKEVIIYDWDNRKRFSFEAKSISLLIESKLSYQEYGFPVPLFPKNPKTNVEFSYKQLISLYYQLKGFGEIRWGLTTLREYNFNKTRWHLYHKSLLTMNAIKTSITLLDTHDAREMLLDFTFAKMDELGWQYSQYIYSVFQIAVATVPNHWFLERLKAVAILYYEAEHLGQIRTRIINGQCLKIFKRLNAFLLDLQNKNIIK